MRRPPFWRFRRHGSCGPASHQPFPRIARRVQLHLINRFVPRWRPYKGQHCRRVIPKHTSQGRPTTVCSSAPTQRTLFPKRPPLSGVTILPLDLELTWKGSVRPRRAAGVWGRLHGARLFSGCVAHTGALGGRPPAPCLQLWQGGARSSARLETWHKILSTR